MASLLYMMIGKKINYQARITLQESLNSEDNAGILKMVRNIFIITAVCELLGFLALAPSLVKFTGNFWSGCYKALFLAVSAFCNAGIDPLGTATAEFSNIACFSANAAVLIPLMVLIVLGGIGFVVIVDVLSRPSKSKRLMLHTRVVLNVTASLIIFGAVVFMIAEWNNQETIGNLSNFDKITNCFFQSVTTRTAGFASFDQERMTQISKLVSGILMFIGGSPMSVAGGIKTTTFFVLLLIVMRNQDQNGNILYHGKKITSKVLSKTIRIALIATLLVFVGTIMVYIFESGNMSIASIVYDVISAICTVGLSFGITPMLCSWSKLTLVLLMYVGRVGMLTIPLAFKSKETNSSIEYVSAKIMVG